MFSVHLIGKVDDRIFDERDVQFTVGEGQCKTTTKVLGLRTISDDCKEGYILLEKCIIEVGVCSSQIFPAVNF